MLRYIILTSKECSCGVELEAGPRRLICLLNQAMCLIAQFLPGVYSRLRCSKEWLRDATQIWTVDCEEDEGQISEYWLGKRNPTICR